MRKRQQLLALLRKNYILQKRKPWGVVVQLVLPAIFYLAFGIIRATLLPPETGEEIPSNPAYSLPAISLYMQNQYLAYIPSDNPDVQKMEENLRYYACNQVCEGNDNNSCIDVCLLQLQYRTKGFLSADELEDYLKDNEDSIWAAVSFIGEDGKELRGSLTKNVRYELRLDGSNLPFNTDTFQEVEIGPTNSGQDYIFSGFTSLQVAVDQALLWFFTGGPRDNFLQVKAQEYPYPKHTTNEFYTAVKNSLAFYTCLGFVYFVIRLVNQIVTEKESKIKEAMKIMGLGDIVYWSSWFISSVSIMGVAMFLLAAAAKISTVYEKSDFFLILFFYEVWGLSIISFCFLISVFFNKSKVASAVSVIVLFVALVPNISITASSSGGSQFVGCLLSPTCLGLATELFCDQEELKVGVTWDNLNEGTLSYTGYIWILIFDIFLYAFLAWYLEEVLPREHGIRRKWYFIFQLSYWMPSYSQGRASKGNMSYGPINDEPEIDENTEPVTTEISARTTVSIKNLQKNFVVNTQGASIVKTAVNKLNLDMYENQITALLGHNGAGKTTTMSMLTGFITPTSGDAVIYNSSILNDIESIRENIGYCPQYNVLWDDLTVEEHIELFAALKGVPPHEQKQHVAERIKEVGLDEKLGSYSRTLSGGQKRKLCVAIAFTGGTKLIFLDEPTSGMDPFSRRAIWDLLQNLKSGRTIVLTTHFMDEADLLGDRIAIMSRGRLAACGSSLYLKTKFGIGYSLTLVKKSSCREASVTEYLHKYDTGIQVLSNVGAELAYVLPKSTVPNFGKLFAGLEKDKPALGIDSYGLSVTTLEEVFLRLADKVETEDANEKRLSAKQEGVSIPMDRILSGKISANKFYDGEIKYERSYWQQFKALLTKRFLVSLRDSKALFQMLFYPTVFVLLAVVISNTIQSDRNTDQLVLNYSNLEEYNEFLFADNTTIAGSAQDLLSLALSAPGYQVQLVSVETENINPYLLANEDIRASAIISTTNASAPVYAYISLYDTTAFHSLPISINFINTAIMRQYTGVDVTVEAVNNPLPVFEFSVSDYAKSFNLALYIGIAVCIIPGALITSIVREREVKATHQQLVSGAKSILLWTTYLISDIVLFLLFCCVIFIIFAASGTDAYIGSNFPATAVLLFAFGLAVFPFTYLLSYVVKNPSAVQTKITTWYIVFSLASLIIISILYSTDSTRSAAEYVDYMFTLVPPYAVAIGIFNISINDISDDIPGEERLDPFHWDVAGRAITFLFVEFAIFSVVLVLFDKGYFDKYIYPPEPTHILDPLSEQEVTDSDVLAEQDRIESQKCGEDAVVVKNLRKVYSNDLVTKVAVKKLSFGIPQGECFGLLGPNGAGKTTTLSILSGDFPPTSGDVWLTGKSILGKKRELFEVISLCPQFDPLLDLMTGREHLYLFGRLRGVPEDKLDIIVENALTILDLDQHADKLTQAYSGGNKRKLSLAIAMLGDPKILFLDEPSTGMDPLARRFMWNVISSFVPGRSIILTTHSMEECEALCTRIGIMVNGRMKCLGSSQHLKNKFGSGYRLEIQTSHEMVEKVKTFIAGIFRDANLLEWHGGKLRYQIASHNMNLATVFENLESNRHELQIEDYALSQTTLEQVFVNFARQQEPEAIPQQSE
eukprot:TRINITY_DN6270_c0_g1_i4.p1 TRINITY_DN6270_c0_g1~~TRINITY_DN6270_c0_g1_i4.p1  ORF type:complete len:1633 (-),score=415.86 TRINITY_DN6270_c0_g1_i4:245-5143(-)